MAERSAAFGLALALLCGPASGCYVRAYQPMADLHRPVVVNPQLPNFEDVRLNVRCLPGGLLTPAEAGVLCQKVGQLFENQGAVVTTSASEHEGADDTGTAPEGDDDDDQGDGPAEVEAPAPTDLTLELRARELHHSSNLLGWLVCLSTFTVVPAVTESTFAQDVVVRDGTGFLLTSQSLEGRLVVRFGIGSWLGNKFLDLLVRHKDERLTGEAVNRDLSNDLYRQLSQVVFNAKMQWQVLQQVPGVAGRSQERRVIALATLALASPFTPDPAPGLFHGKAWSRSLDCERVSAETAAQRYPGQIVTSAPRGDYVNRSAILCRQRLLRADLRGPRDEAILSTLETETNELAGAAESLRPDLADRTWLVEVYYPSGPVAAKVSFAAKNALMRRGLSVSDRTPTLSAEDIEILTRMTADEAFPAACQRYSALGSLGAGDALLGVVLRDPRETILHAGICSQGRWMWLQ